jgi:hypothetical protein
MKTMDAELKKQVEGLKPNQIRLLASIYAGLAARLRSKKVTDSLGNWKSREDYSKN